MPNYDSQSNFMFILPQAYLNLPIDRMTKLCGILDGLMLASFCRFFTHGGVNSPALLFGSQ